MSPFLASFIFWAGWLTLWAALIAVFVLAADVPGHRPRHARPAIPVAAVASVAAVISGWQPRISRLP